MIDFLTGDICCVSADAIVNPTDEQLSGNGGVDRLIHNQAGQAVDNECKAARNCPAGQTIITGAGSLPAKYIIHVSVPKWEENSADAEYLLAACYVNSLNKAKENNLKSIVFPAVGTGSNAFPPERAAEIATSVVWKWCLNHKDCLHVSFIMTSDLKMHLYKKHFLLNVIKAFKDMCSPENLSVLTAHTLPYYFAEHGGFTKLPADIKKQADIYRDKYNKIHVLYSEYMFSLYRTIGSPDYNSLVNRGLNRADCTEQDPVKKFMQFLNLMQLDECICFIVLLQRMDYGSGGTSNVHLKNCINGNVSKVLNRIEILLTQE